MGTPKIRAGTRQRWISAVCGACLLCLVAVNGQAWRGRAAARRGIERSGQLPIEQRPGVNVDLTQYDTSELERVLSDIKDLGFVWLRQHFSWQTIEVAPGLYEWRRWDAVVEATQRRGLRLIAVIDTFPEWAKRQEKYPLPCEPPCDPDAYGRFVSVLADRYASAIDAYQIWDEPNLSRSWGGGHVSPCGYVTLLEAGYEAVHGADSTAWVLGGGLAPTQAYGPENQNDITFLQGIYAAGGGPYLDILAAKPYGFWSGPEDRRVEPDVLNYSRAVAWREIMQARGDARKPIWAVQWGWHVKGAGLQGGAPPWGTDTLAVQRVRILEAVKRARREWPWMGVMCWAEYQPAAAPTSARWGFALASSDGMPNALHGVLRIANDLAHTTDRVERQWPDALSMRWDVVLLLSAVALVDLTILYHVARCHAVLRGLIRWWYSLCPLIHAATLVLLAALYVLTPWVEWVVVELALVALVLWRHPDWALMGAVFCMPFFYWAKAIGGLRIPPGETWLALAVMVHALRRLQIVSISQKWRAESAQSRTGMALGRSSTRQRGDRVRVALGSGWSPLDVAWVVWVLLGSLSPRSAPDPSLAWREWRLCMLEPALLYVLIRRGWRYERSRPDDLAHKTLLSWLASGVAVALIGLIQWVTGTSVLAGVVGRALGPYYSPNHLALYLERILPVALALAGYGLSRWRMVGRLTAAVLCTCLYLTFSRGAWLLAVPAALVVLSIHYRARLRWWAYMVVAGLLALAGVTVFCGRQTPVAALAEEIRPSVWHSAGKMIRDRPWTGFGLDGFQFTYPQYMRIDAWTEPVLYHPHNVWLDAAVRLGIPGVVVFVGLMVCCVYEAARSLASPSARCPQLVGVGKDQLWETVAVGCLAGLLAGLAHGMVDSGYFMVDLAWTTGLVAAMLNTRRHAPVRLGPGTLPET